MLEREMFEEMVHLYYEMVGWDKDGRPTAATLYDLNLDHLVGERS